ncbi:hypothetical protein EW146_g6322 [Bondarzewia mesenterica]|uniref:Carrier domain-containing protein n=1 Tax=Bondarzewia mesenterica TaxID=1095465 RepID=A0A4S4LQZ4_9AGAM|nr:hypothetical protein EW146_g6322 [Bondarzewia mesenterica]
MEHIPPFHTIQAVDSSSFSIPTEYLTGHLPLPALWEHHLDKSSLHPLFIYEHSTGRIEKISWLQGVRAMHRAVRKIKPRLFRVSCDEKGRPPVVGLLAYKDVPSSWAIITAIMRLCATVFFISPRNPPTAVAHLLKEADCHLLLTSSDAAMQDLTQDTRQLLPQEYQLEVAEIPVYDELYTNEEFQAESLPPLESISMDAAALILHSSGSTSTPKVVVHTHRGLVHWGLAPYFGDKDLCGYICGALSLPLYHTMGISMFIVYPVCGSLLIPGTKLLITDFLSRSRWQSSSGQASVIYSPHEPVTLPTADSTLSKALACKSNYIYCVPAFIEEWANNENSIVSLREFDVISFGGGPVRNDIGDLLASRGVRLCSLYGSSEVGAVSRWVFDGDPKDWQYIRISRQVDVHWVPQEDMEHIFEVVVRESPFKRLAQTNTIINGRRSFATKDLFEKHPTKAGLWRSYRRGDDRIVHSTGEKVRIVLCANRSGSNGYVSVVKRIRFFAAGSHAIFFFARVDHQPTSYGSTRLDKAEGESSDTEEVRAFLDKIWPVVEEANRSAPTHSRIFKEADPAKPFKLTAKRTLRRNAILNDYADEILAAYRAMQDADTIFERVALPASWDLPSAFAFVREIVGNVLIRGRNLGDNDDLFQNGADSLQAVVITNAIVHAFKSTRVDASLLGTNFVYSHPTISSLAHFITACIRGDQSVPSQAIVAQKMREMLAGLTRPFSNHCPVNGRQMPMHETILVTGTTGSLGTHIFARLVQIPSVNRIYALNRSSGDGLGESMRKRQIVALERQGLSASLANSPKVVYLEGDIALPGLGLDVSLQADLQGSLTSIIHNAWMVNFNHTLSSYRPFMEGVRNIVDLALASPLPRPPRVVFISSVSAVRGWKKPEPVPERVSEDPTVAVGSGYGESKWVGENILAAARRTTPLRPIIARLGQLCGDTENGSWNASDWFPLMIRSASALNCLPECEGLISWLPIGIAASAVMDLRSAPEHIECINLVHPKPIPWNSIVTPLAHILDVPVVPYSFWLKKLFDASSYSAPSRAVPAVSLVEFFTSLENDNDKGEGEETKAWNHGKIGEAFSANLFDTENARQASTTLSDPALSKLTLTDAELWLAFWRRTGMLAALLAQRINLDETDISDNTYPAYRAIDIRNFGIQCHSFASTYHFGPSSLRAARSLSSASADGPFIRNYIGVADAVAEQSGALTNIWEHNRLRRCSPDDMLEHGGVHDLLHASSYSEISSALYMFNKRNENSFVLAGARIVFSVPPQSLYLPTTVEDGRSHQ